ncbi:hypothetical protein MUK42_28447 [Musa troglodytarum]|uniref:Uncharacterized protein n=1 Tax=Musa troglodytarum TaxID=320322 RepID=A0A9E7F327_9LILI|nr:hypothetical protein MUK42_28447 [Musa troglodytarum]
MISFTNWIICSRHLKLICGVYQKPSVHVVFVFRVFDIDLERIGNIARLGVPISGIRLVDYSLTALFFFYASVLLPCYDVWFEICANRSSIIGLLDTLVGFRRVSGKSSINFSFFELQKHHR